MAPLACWWLGYYARWKYERNSWLDPQYVNAVGSGARAFPLGLRIVGERGYNALYFTRTVSDAEFERIVELFPEADVYCSTDSDPYRAHQRQP